MNTRQSIRNVLLLSLFFCCMAVSVSTAGAQTTISPEKRRLIAELAPVAETRKQIEELVDMMLVSMESQYPDTVDRMLSQSKDMSDSQKAEMKASMLKSNAISKRFRERLPKVINFDKYVEEGIYPIYAKFFTEQELREMVAFYNSPTGRKTVTIMPQLYAESIKAAQEHLLPAVEKLMDEILKEELAIAPHAPESK